MELFYIFYGLEGAEKNIFKAERDTIIIFEYKNKRE